MADVEHARQNRASNADRERAAGLLGDALADGRLTVDEYNERLDGVSAGKTHAELEPLVADVGGTARAPATPGPARRLKPQVAILSETTARPPDAVRGRALAVGVGGNAHIDLSHTAIDESGVAIRARTFMGSVHVTVPADARVSMTGFPVLGSLSPTREVGPADGPRVHVQALAVLGSVAIHRAEADPS